MKHEPFASPCADRLAAYYEGALDPSERRHIEDWLADHPEVAADFIGLQQMQHLFQSAAPGEPADSAWASLRDRIERGLVRARAGRSSFRWLGWSAAAAGAIAVTLLFQGSRSPTVTEVVEVFPVASAEDVEITSVDAAGVRALLVGTPPVQGPIVLMAAGDATLKSVAIEPDGQFPEVRMAPGEQQPPMIVGPLASGSFLTAP